MRRLLKLAVVIVPTVLALLSVVAWVRSDAYEDELTWGAVHVLADDARRLRQFRYASARGRLLLAVDEAVLPPPARELVDGGGWTWSSERIRSWPTRVSVPQRGRVVDVPGVEISSSWDGTRTGYYARSLHLGLSWSVPTAVMLVPAGIATALAWRRRRRRRAGACRECGYDLRASRERCPECGAAIPPS